jgi:hypothetical protein
MKHTLNSKSLFAPTSDDWLVVKCPVCGYDYTHVERVYALEADPGLPKPEGISEYGELYSIPVGGIAEGWRRGTVVIEFYCESQHQFAIHFQQHKGNTFVMAFGVDS